jgi:hypothetical protein
MIAPQHARRVLLPDARQPTPFQRHVFFFRGISRHKFERGAGNVSLRPVRSKAI